jgi:hypothetical protein
MREEPRRFLSPTGAVVELDELLDGLQRSNFELEAELSRTDEKVTHIERRLGDEGPRRYLTLAGALVDLDQDRALLALATPD